MKAKDIMTTKVITVHKNATIAEIAQVLVDHAVSGVPVVDDDGALMGLVSEGDLLRKETSPRIPDFVNLLGGVIYYHGVDQYKEDLKKIMAKQASSIMTEAVITVTETTGVSEIAHLMLQHGIKRIPVVVNGKLVGIISRRDIIKLLVKP